MLPEFFAGDADRMARFQREAHVLASLNHPHIAALYGLEESGDTRALVMELVEGPTLADRLQAGPMPVDEALPIARQIAEALEAAHEKGIVHRDLKPVPGMWGPTGRSCSSAPKKARGAHERRAELVRGVETQVTGRTWLFPGVYALAQANPDAQYHLGPDSTAV